MNIKVLLARRIIKFLFRQISFDIATMVPEGEAENRIQDWKDFGNLEYVRRDLKRWITQLHNQSLKYTDPRTLALLTGQMLVLARILNYKVVKKQPVNKPNYPVYEKKVDSESDNAPRGFKINRKESGGIDEEEDNQEEVAPVEVEGKG